MSELHPSREMSGMQSNLNCGSRNPTTSTSAVIDERGQVSQAPKQTGLFFFFSCHSYGGRRFGHPVDESDVCKLAVNGPHRCERTSPGLDTPIQVYVTN